MEILANVKTDKEFIVASEIEPINNFFGLKGFIFIYRDSSGHAIQQFCGTYEDAVLARQKIIALALSKGQ